MAGRPHTVDEIKKFEDRLAEVLGELKGMRASWASDGPEEVDMESDMAARSISYLEGWVPRQLSRVKKARSEALKEQTPSSPQGKNRKKK